MNNLSAMKYVFSGESREESFLCPSCGRKCGVGTSKCPDCSYDLTDIINISFSQNRYFNEAVLHFKEEKYCEALINISGYLAYSPKDIDAHKLLICCLSRMGLQDEFLNHLDLFEDLFPMDPWIMEVETRGGLDNYVVPKEKFVPVSIVDNPVSEAMKEYTDYRISLTKSLLEFSLRFYDFFYSIVGSSKKKKFEVKSRRRIREFNEKVFLPWLSSREMNLESFDGDQYEMVSDQDKTTLEVVGEKRDFGYKTGEIKTITPAVKIRSKYLIRQKVYHINNKRKKIGIRLRKKK